MGNAEKIVIGIITLLIVGVLVWYFVKGKGKKKHNKGQTSGSGQSGSKSSKGSSSSGSKGSKLGSGAAGSSL